MTCLDSFGHHHIQPKYIGLPTPPLNMDQVLSESYNLDLRPNLLYSLTERAIIVSFLYIRILTR